MTEEKERTAARGGIGMTLRVTQGHAIKGVGGSLAADH